MDWNAAQVQAALLALMSAQAVMIVSTLTNTWTARRQREHDTLERENQRKHETAEAKKKREYDRRVESWRAHREGIASYLRALERTKLDLNRFGELRRRVQETEGRSSSKEKATSRESLRATVMRIGDAKTEISYWAALLPTHLRSVASDARKSIDGERQGSCRLNFIS